MNQQSLLGGRELSDEFGSKPISARVPSQRSTFDRHTENLTIAFASAAGVSRGVNSAVFNHRRAVDRAKTLGLFPHAVDFVWIQPIDIVRVARGIDSHQHTVYVADIDEVTVRDRRRPSALRRQVVQTRRQ